MIKLVSESELLNCLEVPRKFERKIVFTNGCYDILHIGHVDLLEHCKRLGDILVVGLNSDSSVKRLKGESRPVFNQSERVKMLSALETVDYIVMFDEDTPLNLIEKITPDILVKGTDWERNVVGQEWVEKNGGAVVLATLTEGYSTTDIIERIKKMK